MPINPGSLHLEATSPPGLTNDGFKRGIIKFNQIAGLNSNFKKSFRDWEIKETDLDKKTAAP
jgi:hypothetical protein